MKKKKTKVKPFFKILAFINIIITIFTLILVKLINVLPNTYYFILIGILIIICIILFYLIIRKRGRKRQILGALISIFYSIILIFLSIYALNTLGFLNNIGFKNFKIEKYSLIILNTSEYDSLDELNELLMGSLEFNTDGLIKVKQKIEKKISPKFKTYADINTLTSDLLNNKIDSMLIESSILNILLEDNKELNDNYKIIYEISINIKTEDITDSVNITKEPFNIFISGIDSYGGVASVARSDVNMLVSVNPKTNKILITSIPRDYYVVLGGINQKDKLTHAGIYGIDVSVKTIEELLDININYYIKVNFTSVVKIVDALGGVSVYSDYDFTSIDDFSYKKGYNNLMGEEALSFARERQAFRDGDRQRIKNQAHLFDALVKKATSNAIITKYNSLLKALGNSFLTNIDTDSITSFIKKQIKDNKEWDITNISLTGTDSLNYTYSYKGSKLYVMEPNLESINDAKKKIFEITGRI